MVISEVRNSLASVVVASAIPVSATMVFSTRNKGFSTTDVLERVLYMKITRCLTDEGCRAILKFLCQKSNIPKHQYVTPSEVRFKVNNVCC